MRLRRQGETVPICRCHSYLSFYRCFESFCRSFASFYRCFASFCRSFASFCRSYLSFYRSYPSFCRSYPSFCRSYPSFCRSYLSFCRSFASFYRSYLSFCCHSLPYCLFHYHPTVISVISTYRSSTLRPVLRKPLLDCSKYLLCLRLPYPASKLNRLCSIVECKPTVSKVYTVDIYASKERLAGGGRQTQVFDVFCKIHFGISQVENLAA